MDKNELNCPYCGEKGVPIVVKHKPKKKVFLLILKCSKHKFRLKIHENEIKNYLDYIVTSVYKCPDCGTHGSNYKTEYNFIIAGGGKHHLLSILKKCDTCNKKFKFEITNILYPLFYDKYFEYIKRKKNNQQITEYKKILQCSECNHKLIVREINLVKNSARIIGFCSGPQKHSITVDLPLEHQYNWMSVLPQAINLCENCNSDDLYIYELNFGYIEGSLYFIIMRRILNQICNNCGTQNKIIINHNFYEIYRRILKEKSHNSLHPTPLLCSECNSEALLEKISSLKTDLQLVNLCQQKHRIKTKFPKKNLGIWLEKMLFGVKRCKKCWSKKQRVDKIVFNFHAWGKTQIQNTKITIRCLECRNQRIIKINNILFDELSDYLLKDF